MIKKKPPAHAKYNLGGRPTKFRPEFCEKLIDHMAKGLSFETFGAEIGTSRTQIYEWAKPENRDKYPGFADAKSFAQEECRKFWETVGGGIATGQLNKGNAAVWIYNMKCRFAKEWRDHKELPSNVNITLSYNPDD